MPIYCVPMYVTHYAGASELPIWPCDLEDANGNILSGYQLYVDTDTGITIEHVYDANGNPIEIPSGGVFVCKVVLHPAPLKILPYDPNNHVKPIIVGKNP